MCLSVLVCVNFGDEILLREKNIKPEKNSIFLNKGKIVISVENRKFSRSRMIKQILPFNLSHEI